MNGGRRGYASLCSSAGPQTVTRIGRLAQRESASFTPRRSLVRSQYRPRVLPAQRPVPIIGPAVSTVMAQDGQTTFGYPIDA
jgi:hypothetical protein